MPTTLIGRVVLWDLLKVAILTLVGLSGLFVLGGAILEAGKSHLEPIRVLQIIPLLIPPTLPYTLPTSLLFACTFVYSKLSANQEITALKAGGVHIGHVLAPAVILSAMTSVSAIYLSDQFIPACEARLHRMLMDDVEANILAYLKQQGMIVDVTFPYEIYVDEVRDGRLINAIFKQRGQNGRYELVAKAAEAELHVVPASHSVSADPVVEVRLMNSVAWSKSAQGHWQDQTYRMPLPSAVKKGRQASSMPLLDCLAVSREHAAKAYEADFYIASAAALNAFQGDFLAFSQVLPTNRIYADRQVRRSKEMRAEVHARLSQSAAPFLFAALGCPIGILLRRRDFIQTFFISFLPIVILFYPSLILARNLVKEGYTSPGLTVWTPTILLFLASIPLLRRVIRH